MRSFRFDELLLLSEKEGRARQILWSRGRNALVGSNHTGKSTVLRMLFETFGCKGRPLGDEWDRRVTALVTFSLEDHGYQLLRRQSLFALFNSKSQLLWATEDSGELRSRISALLNFVLPLTNQQGEPKQARPAFFFLPTFIDQDGSWGSAWDTFEGLHEFRGWQQPTIELALGIRTSEYWRAYTDLQVEKRRACELENEVRTFKQARESLERKYPRVQWFKSALSFRQELKELEQTAGELAREQDRLSNECAEAAAARDALRAQALLVESALAAHAADMRFLDTRRVGEDIICPTCGTPHEHSFAQRLNLEAEADELRELREALVGKADRAEGRLIRQQEQLAKLEKQADELDRVLGRTRGELTLRNIIRHAGIDQAYATLDEQLREVTSAQLEQALLMRQLTLKLKALDNPGRKQEIKQRFDRLYEAFARQLEVPPSLQTRKGQIFAKPRTGGSGGPRAVLAFYFAISHVASESSEGYLPPLVLDSPHEKAQDEINRPMVTKFIFDHKVPSQQLIVALEDPPPDDVVFDKSLDARIDLDAKYAVLRADDYPIALERLEPLLRMAVAHVGSELF